MKISTGLWMALVTAQVFNACSKKESQPGTENNFLVARTVMDVKYGDSAWQNADIYLPANRSSTNTGVLILVHGGSWIAGDKRDISFLIPSIQKNLPGVAIVNMNYALANGKASTRFPAQHNDFDKLVSFIEQKQTEYGVSNSLAMAGISSGGHLALSYALSNSLSAKKLLAIASASGPTDLTDDAYKKNAAVQSVTSLLLGSTYSNNSSLYVKASPLLQLPGASIAPTLLVHGTIDNLVPVTQAEKMYEVLKAQSAQHKMVLIPNEGHEYTPAGIALAVNAISDFMKPYLVK